MLEQSPSPPRLLNTGEAPFPFLSIPILSRSYARYGTALNRKKRLVCGDNRWLDMMLGGIQKVQNL